MPKKIVIIDDEEMIRESLAGIMEDEGFTPLTVADGEAGLALLQEEAVDLVLLDIWMPGMDGMEVLPKIKEMWPDLPVIMISGHGNIETAVQATKMGAFDFIEKPPSYDKIILSINNALKLSSLARENALLKESGSRFQELTGNSSVMVSLRQQLRRVAPSDAWVLIRGEHGTGKELAAQTIHHYSGMADKPMVEVNCAAIPEELIESELFGHEKGAFTGATTAKRGKFDQADGSILFLDEIGDMSMNAQAKVLRILQEQKFERVGGSKTISVNVRVLAATNKDLEKEIERGNFRADLFYRLNVIPITLPPLRQRLEDIPDLVADLMKVFVGKGFSERTFTPAALAAMQCHDWPGNVRELRNFLERLLIMCADEVIDGEQVTMLLGNSAAAAQGPNLPTEDQDMPAAYDDVPFKEAKKKFERDFLCQRLKANDGNVSKTAEEIGMERSHLHKKIKALGISLS